MSFAKAKRFESRTSEINGSPADFDTRCYLGSCYHSGRYYRLGSCPRLQNSGCRHRKTDGSRLSYCNKSKITCSTPDISDKENYVEPKTRYHNFLAPNIIENGPNQREEFEREFQRSPNYRDLDGQFPNHQEEFEEFQIEEGELLFDEFDNVLNRREGIDSDYQSLERGKICRNNVSYSRESSSLSTKGFSSLSARGSLNLSASGSSSLSARGSSNVSTRGSSSERTTGSADEGATRSANGSENQMNHRKRNRPFEEKVLEKLVAIEKELGQFKNGLKNMTKNIRTNHLKNHSITRNRKMTRLTRDDIMNIVDSAIKNIRDEFENKRASVLRETSNNMQQVIAKMYTSNCNVTKVMEKLCEITCTDLTKKIANILNITDVDEHEYEPFNNLDTTVKEATKIENKYKSDEAHFNYESVCILLSTQLQSSIDALRALEQDKLDLTLKSNDTKRALEDQETIIDEMRSQIASLRLDIDKNK